MCNANDARRSLLTTCLAQLHTGELELGVTDALQRHISRNVVAAKPVSQRKLNFERQRPRWLREMTAEAVGVFFYVFPGIGAVAAWTINKEDAGFASLFQIGFAFALGIAFAIITCAPVSGGLVFQADKGSKSQAYVRLMRCFANLCVFELRHFNPAVTISLAIWQGFPWAKVPRYIFSQVSEWWIIPL